ncbi:MAG: hypothetical protein ACT4TC_02835 [Myxococcaceae bacterium]
MRALIATLLLSSAALAQSSEREVASIRNDFIYGKHENALERAKDRINRGQLAEDELVELHKIAALSAHFLGRGSDALGHFTSLLRLDPDFSLDPFTVPPPAVKAFEKIRKDMVRELDVVRQKKRLEAEMRRRDQDEQERARRDAEEQRRRVEDLSRRVTLRTVEKRSLAVNFLPFGAGQFQQGRNRFGIVLAVSEGAAATTSAIAYLALAALIKPRTTVVPGYQTPSGGIEFTEWGISREAEGQASVWRYTKIISGALFYALYALGVADALFHHEDEVASTTLVDAPVRGK